MTLSVQVLDIPEAETLARREYHLSGERLVIGRDFTADLCLPDISARLSRSHLELVQGPDGGWSVRDTSTNGSTLNGAPLARATPVALSDGDILGCAGYRLLLGFVGPGRAAAPADPAPAPAQAHFAPAGPDDARAPLLLDLPLEESAPEDEGFSSDRLENLDALMFDPFAEGPGLRDAPDAVQGAAQGAAPRPAPATVPTTAPTTAFEAATPITATEIAFAGGSGDLVDVALRLRQEADLSARRYKDDAAEAMARAIDRFLAEIDPATLEPEYRSYMPGWVSRSKRYWQIHKKQFARKRESGELRRSFLALFAEEMRRR